MSAVTIQLLYADHGRKVDPIRSVMPKVSVILAVGPGQQAVFRRCLSVLAGETHEYERCEVVVVDDGNTKQTQGTIEAQMRRHPRLRVLLFPGPNRGFAAARNLGWQAARGELVAFAPVGLTRALWSWLSVACRTLAQQQEFQGARIGGQDGQGYGWLFRREALQRAGGFDERFASQSQAERDLQFRIESAGGSLMATDERCAPSEGRMTQRLGLVPQLKQYTMSNALLYKKHRKRYRLEIEPTPPLEYYAIAGSLLACVVLVFSGLFIAAVGAGICCLALFAGFVSRHLREVPFTPRNVLPSLMSLVLVPLLDVYWRMCGALKYRVLFV
jgi:hypothetical protein